MEVRTQEAYNAAVQFYADIGRYMWIGANDIEVDRNWVWESNQDEVNLSEFWRDGSPRRNSDLNCGMIVGINLTDYYCDQINTFFCEFI